MTKSEMRPPNSETLGDPRNHPAVRNYMLFCLSSLFLLVVCLADRGLEWWSLMPALIGCLTLITSWGFGPPLVLLSLAMFLGMAGPRPGRPSGGWPSFQTPDLMDLVLCIAVLAYIAGHYRLLSLMRNIFPPDSRQARDEPSRRRSVDLVGTWEISRLGLVLPLWTALALILWALMMESWLPQVLDLPGSSLLGMSSEVWNIIWLIWMCLAPLAAVGILTSYLRQATATPEESLVFLQDQCWRHTRREQGILNRWLAWARIRVQRKQGQL